MSPMIFWMLGISFSSAMMVLTVAFEVRLLQFSLAFVIAGFIVLAGVRDHRTLHNLNAFPSHAMASIVRHMGVVYGWAGVCIVLLYGLLLEWSTWLPAFIIMSLGATLCLFLANILMRDLAEDADDSNVISLVRSISKAQFAATCVAFGGLISLGKFSPSALGGDDSWAAVNIMLCAAMGIAALSGYIIAMPLFETADTEAEASAAPVQPKSQPVKKQVRTFGRATRPA